MTLEPTLLLAIGTMAVAYMLVIPACIRMLHW